jgi:voltage-gated potassium channel
MEFTLTFIDYLFTMIYLTFPLLILFQILIILLGQIVGRIEKWSIFNALYWSFITAFTVGYGDIRPLKKRSKIMAIIIALIGIMFTGIIVAITVTAATQSFKEHIAITQNNDK